MLELTGCRYNKREIKFLLRIFDRHLALIP